MHRLRALDDFDVRRSQLSDGGKRLVLIGPGWIGMEVAATVRTRGNGVTILERDPIPLPNLLRAMTRRWRSSEEWSAGRY